MPRIKNTCEFLAGYIKGRMGELHAMLDTLASDTHLSELEMQHMRQRIDLLDASVRSQHRAIEDRRMRPPLNLYEGILSLALQELTRREQHRGQRPPESDAMRARRLRTDSDLDAYASDGKGEVPFENWTVVDPATNRTHVNADDLRRTLDDRRAGRNQCQWEPMVPANNALPIQNENGRIEAEPIANQMEVDENQAGLSGLQRIEEPRRSPVRHRRERNNSSRSSSESPDDRRSINSAWSRSSINSYASSHQTSFTRPQLGIPLPPMLNELPYRIELTDQDLIGRTEIYIQRQSPENRNRCPQCHHHHRMIRCDTFRNFNLQRRWYAALYHGVCVNCLRGGHSHFRCFKEGACNRCNIRHNSMLCPQHPANH